MREEVYDDVEIVEVDMKEIVTKIIKNLLTIGLCGILGLLIGMFYSNFSLEPTYVSTTQMYVTNELSDTGAKLEIKATDIQTSTYLTKDYVLLAKSKPVLEMVIYKMNLDMTVEELSNAVSISTPTDTRVLTVKVTDSDPIRAKQIADMVREVAKTQIKAVMGIENVITVEEANVATKASSPNKKAYYVLGCALGILLSTLMTIILSVLDDSIKSEEDIERKVGLSVIGIIPIRYEE